MSIASPSLADDLGDHFANPAGWVLVPVTLAASRIFPALTGR